MRPKISRQGCIFFPRGTDAVRTQGVRVPSLELTSLRRASTYLLERSKTTQGARDAGVGGLQEFVATDWRRVAKLDFITTFWSENWEGLMRSDVIISNGTILGKWVNSGRFTRDYSADQQTRRLRLSSRYLQATDPVFVQDKCCFVPHAIEHTDDEPPMSRIFKGGSFTLGALTPIPLSSSCS